MPQRPKRPLRTASPSSLEIIDIGPADLEAYGFFCYMSKKKSEGYQRKLAWLRDRFAEGMRLKLLKLPERGFIEYIPGESAWRAVHAEGFMLIHCLWVVGRSKGRGFGRTLINECLADAQRAKMKGVAMVTSETVWMSGRRLLDALGFECVDTAPPAFSLMVKKFGKQPSPSFAGNWAQKARACGPNLTILRSDQCPYIVDAVALAETTAAKAGVKSQVIELKSRDDLMRRSPSPYGVFGLVLDGRLLSYHYQLEKDLLPLLSASGGTAK